MANLFYVDDDGTIKTVANTDSPSFIGTPNTSSVENHNNRDIVNVYDTTEYIDSIISGFNLTRFIYGNISTLSGLEPGKKYMVSVYGRFNPGNNDTYNLGPVAIVDSNNRILNTTGSMLRNLINPKYPITQNATLIINKVPNDGKITGLINFNTDNSTGVKASYMTAIRLS